MKLLAVEVETAEALAAVTAQTIAARVVAEEQAAEFYT